MEKFIKFNNFKNLQKFLKDLKEKDYKKEIFEIKKIISQAYNGVSYHIHIRYTNKGEIVEIKKELFPDFELQGFWVVRIKNNNISEKFYIREYEFK